MPTVSQDSTGDTPLTEAEFCASLLMRWARGRKSFTDIDLLLHNRYQNATEGKRTELRTALTDMLRNAERIGQNLSTFSSIDAFEQSRQ
jgi:hypothetical protein